ncbi:MAG: sigma-54-dependent Fis family transcriptional regulator [Candidatus Glassbacteria bacterium]|nr:sigma-54-dependent Fis family transcriptional regulator [Candidatus Glassbacteria bacterium]
MTDTVDYKILVTSSDPEASSRVIGALSAKGYTASGISAPPRPVKLQDAGQAATVIVLTGDIHEAPALRFLEAVRHAPPSLGVICLIEPTEPEKLSFFDRLGVDAVFEKPVAGEEIAQAVVRLIERKRLIGSIGLIGKTPAMREVVERVAQYSQVNSTVLISGDSGTGKELVAQAIHRLSERRHKQFIAVNCAAIAEGVLESELFGHEKGAFTGASSLRKGHFEFASGGTIFLDEIGEMPLSVQVKLLRVLEEREFMRVGGSQKIRVDVRMIAATNKNLELEVEQGNFRRDLYYRLKVLSIHIPPLRDRREDIPLMLNYFIEQFCRENNKTFAGIDQEALAILQNYDWPGNVRELRNLAESMVVLSLGSRIRAKDIPEQIYRRGSPERLLPVLSQPAQADDDWGRRQEAIERRLLYKAVMGLQKDIVEIRQMLIGRGVIHGDEFEGTGVRGGDYDSGDRPAGGYPERDISEVGSVQLEPDSGTEKRPNMQEIERAAILETLAGVGGNRRKAARILGIGERTLYRKLKEYGLS